MRQAYLYDAQQQLGPCKQLAQRAGQRKLEAAPGHQAHLLDYLVARVERQEV